MYMEICSVNSSHNVNDKNAQAEQNLQIRNAYVNVNVTSFIYLGVVYTATAICRTRW